MWVFVGLFLIYLAFDWLKRLPKVRRVHKKCVLITGCDSGFGKALARSLYDKGVYVFAGCFTQDGARKLAEETGERLKVVMLDVREKASISQAYQFVKENLPPDTVLWGLVNNAGVQGYNLPVEFIPKEHIHDIMNVNCYGPVEMVRSFLPLLKKSRGRIVNVVSAAGKMAVPFNHPYLISKFAMMGFTEALRREKEVWGVKVSSVCPGFYATNIANTDACSERNKAAWEREDQATRDDYGQEYYDKLVGVQNELNKNAPVDLSPVVTSLEHALFARWPRNVYHAGLESKILMFVAEFLPAIFMDRLASWYFREKDNTPKALQ